MQGLKNYAKFENGYKACIESWYVIDNVYVYGEIDCEELNEAINITVQEIETINDDCCVTIDINETIRNSQFLKLKLLDPLGNIVLEKNIADMESDQYTICKDDLNGFKSYKLFFEDLNGNDCLVWGISSQYAINFVCNYCCSIKSTTKEVTNCCYDIYMSLYNYNCNEYQNVTQIRINRKNDNGISVIEQVNFDPYNSKLITDIVKINSSPICFEDNEEVILELLDAQNNVICVQKHYIECDCSCDEIDIRFEPDDPVGNDCCWILDVDLPTQTECELSELKVDIYDSNDNLLESFTDLTIQNTLCLDNSTDHEIQYKVRIGNKECKKKTTTLKCGICDCPENTWLNIQLDPYQNGCPTDYCKLLYDFTDDFLENYLDCYPYYDLKIVAEELNSQGEYELVYPTADFTGITHPFGPNGEIAGLPTCIEKGTRVKIELRLFSELANNPTEYEALEYCLAISNEQECDGIELMNRATRCDDLNGEGEWEPGEYSVTVRIGDCVYTVYYTYRNLANGYQDVQLLSHLKRSGNCNLNEEIIFRNAVAKAIKSILESEEDYKPQKSDESPCYEFWRVFQNTCWSKWSCYDPSRPTTDSQYFWVWVPCDSECCSKKLKVCWTENGIRITQIGVGGSGTDDCTQATNQDIVDENLLLENGKSDCESFTCLI